MNTRELRELVGRDVRAVAVHGDRAIVFGPRSRRVAHIIAGAGLHLVIGDDAGLTAYEVGRRDVVDILNKRASKASSEGRARVATALGDAAVAVASRPPDVSTRGAVALYGLYNFAFDQVVGVRSLPDADKLLTWLNHKVAAPNPWHDADGNSVQPPPVGRPWAWAAPMSGDVEFGATPVSWYARHIALLMLAGGNTDHQDPATSATLVDLAAAVVRDWSGVGDTDRSRVLAFLAQVDASLPPAATFTRAFVEKEREITGWVRPTTVEIIKAGVSRTADQVVDATRPPGGYGVGIFAVLTVMGLALIYRKGH